MSVYNGIPINESKLVANYVLFIFLFLLTIAAAVYLLHSQLNGRDAKRMERIKKLRAQTATDEKAAKRLAKEERSLKKRRKENRAERIRTAFLWCLIVCAGVLILVFGVIQPMQDHIKKDYVVYTGEIEVFPYIRDPYITLEDGTVVYGGRSLSSEDTYATIVYAKRSRRLLGVQK